MALTQVQKIFALSSVLALGFVLILLSGALYNSWLPLTVIVIVVLAPVPNALCGNSRSSDFMSETPDLLADFARFCTGFLLVSALVLPTVYWHVGMITLAAMFMYQLGGMIIYGSIVSFGALFYDGQEDY